ncbi:hypothetical protein ACQJBY_000763 [Aegilops geniculata]
MEALVAWPWPWRRWGAEELSADQGQAGQKVSAGLEEPDGEAGATRGLAEGQRGALAGGARRRGKEGRWPGGARRRGAGLEEPDGGAWRKAASWMEEEDDFT